MLLKFISILLVFLFFSCSNSQEYSLAQNGYTLKHSIKENTLNFNFKHERFKIKGMPDLAIINAVNDLNITDSVTILSEVQALKIKASYVYTKELVQEAIDLNNDSDSIYHRTSKFILDSLSATELEILSYYTSENFEVIQDRLTRKSEVVPPQFIPVMLSSLKHKHDFNPETYEILLKAFFINCVDILFFPHEKKLTEVDRGIQMNIYSNVTYLLKAFDPEIDLDFLKDDYLKFKEEKRNKN